MIQTVKADGRAEYEFFERMRSRSRETKNSVAEAVEKIIEAVRCAAMRRCGNTP